MDPVRCRGDVTCVCLQACEHARHVLSEEARRDEAGRGEVRREREKSGEGRGGRGRQARREQAGTDCSPPFYRLPPCSEIDSAGAGIDDRERGGDEDHGDEQ